MACLAMIISRSPSLFKSKRTHDSINNVINAIVEVRICFYDVLIKDDCSKKHNYGKLADWICSSTFDSFFDKEFYHGHVPNFKKVDNYRWELEGRGGVWIMVSLDFFKNTQGEQGPLLRELGLTFVGILRRYWPNGQELRVMKFMVNHKRRWT
ncbi:hypothetical protein Tco_0007964 [Tanacetum coccineum]